MINFLPALRRLLICLIVGGAVIFGPATMPASALSASDTYEADVIKYANVERAKKRVALVKANSCLDRYAEAQAKAMATKKRMYHQSMSPILKACNLNLVGENVAFGYGSGKSVTAAWMKSPSHRANLLNSKHRLIGVGAYKDSRGYWYVSEVLGRSR